MKFEFYFPTDMVIVPPRHKNPKQITFWDKGDFEVEISSLSDELDNEKSTTISIDNFQRLLFFIASGKKRNEKDFKLLRENEKIRYFDLVICNYLDKYLHCDKINAIELNKSEIRSDNLLESKKSFQNFLNLFIIDGSFITIPVLKKDFLDKNKFEDKKIQSSNILLNFYLKLFEKGSWLIRTNKDCLKYAAEVVDVFEDNIEFVNRIHNLKKDFISGGTPLTTSEKEIIRNLYTQHICKNTDNQKVNKLLSCMDIWKPFFSKGIHNGDIIFENYISLIKDVLVEKECPTNKPN